MKLNKKIFAAFIGFIIFPMILLGATTYMLFQHSTQKKYGEQLQFTMKAVGRNIETMFKEANSFSDFWVTSTYGLQDHHRIFESILSEGRVNTRGELLYDQLVDSDRLLKNTVMTYPPIKSVALYDFTDKVVSVNFVPDKPIPHRELISHPVFEEVKRMDGAPKWIAPYEAAELNGENNFFVQIRLIKDLYTLEDKGVLVLRFQMVDLDRMFEFYNRSSSNKEGRYFIMNKEGLIVFDNRHEIEGNRIDAYLSAGVTTDEPFSIVKTAFMGEESLVSAYPLKMEALGLHDWSLISVTSWNYLSRETNLILLWTAGLTLPFLICALLFNLLFVNKTVRFITQIVGLMRRVECGELDTRVQVTGNDETTVLATGFNSMVGRISDLLQEIKWEQQRKTKAEMALLQAQIKPHFLFNTLESINILAVQNQGKIVSQMVLRLGKLLRISIYSSEVITIGQELEHLTSYLEIQKFRFEEKFAYQIDVPEHLLEYRILKLTLQPLVENCIQHGFDGSGRFGRIRIYAAEEKDGIGFYVEDNGMGISGETLLRLEGALEREATLKAGPGEQGGLGIRNVADRIRIQYGGGYKLTICSAPGYGTIVKCKIPKTTGSVDNATEVEGSSSR
jgi:two-component system sensor histidine kinase YesM